MTIGEALEALRTAADAYLLRGEDGMPVIPRTAQRPLYLYGPPGVGKTAIVAQVCAEKGLGLVSYTMTHHTRQTLLGLPSLVKRTMDEAEVTVTEYTMSEIIAEVHRVRRESGCAAGILFLDEINCVSETLMPALLELLQNKRFGRYPVPEDWLLVCAGNPPAYNRNARAFDAVTLDRLRVLDIEPSLDEWERFAAGRRVHPAVRGYLRLRPDDFYHAQGAAVVTARGWTDLSDMLTALERLGREAGAGLIGEYLRSEEIARRFALYLALTRRTASLLSAEAVLEGNADGAEALADLPFEEAVFAAELLASGMIATAAEVHAERAEAERLGYFVQGLGDVDGEALRSAGDAQLKRLEHALNVRREIGTLDAEAERAERRLIARAAELLSGADTAGELRRRAEVAGKLADDRWEAVRRSLERALAFARAAFPDPHVMTVLTAELRAAPCVSRMLARELDAQAAVSGAEARAARLRAALTEDAGQA